MSTQLKEMGYSPEETVEINNLCHTLGRAIFEATEVESAAVLDENLQANIAFGLVRLISVGNNDREVYFIYKKQTYLQNGFNSSLVV